MDDRDNALLVSVDAAARNIVDWLCVGRYPTIMITNVAFSRLGKKKTSYNVCEGMNGSVCEANRKFFRLRQNSVTAPCETLY